ncbi:hypothetical protein QJS66_12220 [Kocuria rhizophila]|nr:hypothetical protein QJS66_12220 [Kocuria rhizophila]
MSYEPTTASSLPLAGPHRPRWARPPRSQPPQGGGYGQGPHGQQYAQGGPHTQGGPYAPGPDGYRTGSPRAPVRRAHRGLLTHLAGPIAAIVSVGWLGSPGPADRVVHLQGTRARSAAGRRKRSGSQA